MAAADVVSYDGWYAWRVGDDGPTLNDLRHQIAAGASAGASGTSREIPDHAEQLLNAGCAADTLGSEASTPAPPAVGRAQSPFSAMP